ncbi:MAG TPA: DUF2304 domain-containing protein [Solirubrobacteraceae bacterium]|nr:DUF2304 domain-containing protein [Solirubrobacteraceae bacterium]
MSRVQIVSILAMALLFVLVFELVRRRRLMERYALLWLFSAATLLMLAVWRDVLELFAGAVGIFYAPSALFAIALGFVLMLLLHFSLVISRLADQSKVLAQRVGLLEREIDVLRVERSLSDIERGAPGAERVGDRHTATLPAGDPPS